jgi:hypothetical protein
MRPPVRACAAVAQRLAHQHRDRQRIAIGEIQQRPPVFHVRQAPLVLGRQGSRQFQPPLERHPRYGDACGQIAQPVALVTAGGQQELRFGLARGAQEIGQFALLLCAPLRFAALGKTGDRLYVVPDPQQRQLLHHLQGRTAPLGFVQCEPLLRDVGECPREVVQRARQRLVLLEGREQHWPFNPAGLAIPAGELGCGGGLPAARIRMQQHDGVIVEGAVERQQGFVAPDEARIRTRRQAFQLRTRTRQAEACPTLAETCPTLTPRKQRHRLRLEDHRHHPVL